ncbi:MAG TPA: VWA domain-containing protein [Acidimicrobiales bacterium]|nr:VWA domain-containing protein [Acidimicrobiales bacterium]
MPADVERIAVGFATTLRKSGVAVPTRSVLDFVAALGKVGIDTRSAVYWAGRATLLRRHEDLRAYDDAFAVYWLQRELIRVPQTIEPVVLELDDDSADEDDDGPEEADDDRGDETDTIAVRYSPVEILRHKDFADYTHAEFDEARKVMAEMRLAAAVRASRRLRRAKGSRPTAHPDLRRTVQRAMKLHGEPARRAYFERNTRPRRLVLLCDVSGSMEAYSRALLRFLHAAVVGRRHVEAFALGTRLTRLTRELSSHDPDAALAAAGRGVKDWSGGTRLGEVLREFNDRFGVRGMARGAVVVILSDGWDRGEPAELAAQMARLHRVAHRVVWCNPLKASPGYAPLARGMAAALPHVDEFIEGHSLASLERLAEVVNRR